MPWPKILAWGAVTIYVAVTIYLTWRGARQTKSLESFAVGNRDIPPSVIGLSLSAQLTSVATFVTNPGLVYAYGLSALLGFGVAAASGIIVGLLLFTHKFRKLGGQVQALTVPQWIGARYGSKGLQAGFGFLSLGLVSYAVLIVVAVSVVLSVILGVPAQWVVVAAVVFVFGYVLLGGVNTHAYTNAIQAGIMLIVAFVLVGGGLSWLWREGGIFTNLQAISPELVSITNSKSLYFRNLFEVFACNFIVGVALVCQPHVASKALYLKDDSQVRRYLTVAILAGFVLMTVMIVGLYARVVLKPELAMELVRKSDPVVTHYIAQSFGPLLRVVISIGILCAGLSTLEGIILALSAILSGDIYLNLTSRRQVDPQVASQRALLFGRIGLILIGAVCVVLSFWQLANPTGGSVLIFAMYGIYLLFTVSFIPLACGMFFPSVTRGVVTAASAAAVVGYFLPPLLALNSRLASLIMMHNNPAFLATCGMAAGWLAVGIGSLVSRGKE